MQYFYSLTYPRGKSAYPGRKPTPSGCTLFAEETLISASEVPHHAKTDDFRTFFSLSTAAHCLTQTLNKERKEKQVWRETEKLSVR